MKQARRVDTGELVHGYYACIAGEVHIIFTGRIDITTIKTSGEITKENFEIDPATVEDVAVKPIKLTDSLFKCPNCNRAYNPCGEAHAYCPGCGQRLDWSGEDETLQ